MAQRNEDYERGDEIGFGKYKGKLIEDVIIDDPRYIEWAVDNTRINLSEDLMELLEKSNRADRGMR